MGLVGLGFSPPSRKHHSLINLLPARFPGSTSHSALGYLTPNQFEDQSNN